LADRCHSPSRNRPMGVAGACFGAEPVIASVADWNRPIMQRSGPAARALWSISHYRAIETLCCTAA
jgi:hypothetical protein